MLHQVGVSFDLYCDARKHKIKKKIFVKMHRLRYFKIAAIGVIQYYIIVYIIRAADWFSKIRWLIYEGLSKKFRNKFFFLLFSAKNA